MLCVPAGGPGEGQRFVPYQPQPQPPTSDAESGMGSVTTQTCDGTLFGDEEPMGLVMSDDGLTDPSTGPSVEREAAEVANLDVPGQVAGNSAPEEQNPSNQDQPEEEGLHTQAVLDLLHGVAGAVQARNSALPAEIQVSLGSLLPIPDNPYGEGYSTEVQAPSLDQQILGDPALLPSAPSADQALQTKPFEDLHEPKEVHEGGLLDQLTKKG